MSFPFKIHELKHPEDVTPYWNSIELGVKELYGAQATPAGLARAKQFLNRSLAESDTVCLVGTDSKSHKFAGIIFIARYEQSFVGRALPYVYLLYTSPDFRRARLAAELIDHAERILKGRGIKHLAGSAGHNDDAIISMGERRGYLRESEFMVKEL